MRALIPCLLFALSASAADREFRDVVDSISNRFNTRPMHIPMFGLVNAVAYVVRPAGTKHIDLAVFENLDNRRSPASETAEMIRKSVGGSWKPFVQSRTEGEVAFVYMRPEGNDCRLLVITVEHHEATVVQLQLNPEGLQRWIKDPLHNAMMHSGSHSRSRDLDP
jgi:hypothetical protein